MADGPTPPASRPTGDPTPPAGWPTDPLPELSPVSLRIQQALDHMVARHPERAAGRIGRIRMNPFVPAIDTTPPELTRVDPDPAHMQRLKVTEEARAVERPARTEDDLRSATPQFSLRNTWRLEMYGDPAWVEFQVTSVRTQEVDDYMEIARRCDFGDRRLPALSTEEHRVAVAERRVIMIDTPWHSIFGRAERTAEPVDPSPDSNPES